MQSTQNAGLGLSKAHRTAGADPHKAGGLGFGLLTSGVKEAKTRDARRSRGVESRRRAGGLRGYDGSLRWCPGGRTSQNRGGALGGGAVGCRDRGWLAAQSSDIGAGVLASAWQSWSVALPPPRSARTSRGLNPSQSRPTGCCCAMRNRPAPALR